jgi:hypothetical protein
MGEKKRKEESKRTFIFERKNYLWMFIGLFLIGLRIYFNVWRRV